MTLPRDNGGGSDRSVSVTRMRDDGGACDLSKFFSIDRYTGTFIKDAQYFPPVPPWLPPPEEDDDEEEDSAFAMRTTREVM